MTTYRNDLINVSSFEPGEEVRIHVGHKRFPEGIVISNGTVEVTLWGKTRRLPALRSDDGRVSPRGIVGRYRTGAKSWPAYTDASADGATVYVNFGRDERQGRCIKTNCLFFAEA